MKVLFTVFFLFFALLASAQDKEVYQLLEKGTATMIDLKLQQLATQKGEQVKAYKGALLARKAAHLKAPKKKLKVFKEGVNILEQTIEKNPKNIENRFLRYVIQVKSPKFLNYKEKIEEDKKRIEEGNINAVLKSLILNFNQKNEQYKLTVK